mmetsp:Transcript_58751/g.148852  ORF Transcript_58751/g.148852 Transcript_58751/m.148852 type:complete len:238 (-) Transcript_58751:297-1010(-)
MRPLHQIPYHRRRTSAAPCPWIAASALGHSSSAASWPPSDSWQVALGRPCRYHPALQGPHPLRHRILPYPHPQTSAVPLPWTAASAPGRSSSAASCLPSDWQWSASSSRCYQHLLKPVQGACPLQASAATYSSSAAFAQGCSSSAASLQPWDWPVVCLQLASQLQVVPPQALARQHCCRATVASCSSFAASVRDQPSSVASLQPSDCPQQSGTQQRAELAPRSCVERCRRAAVLRLQ